MIVLHTRTIDNKIIIPEEEFQKFIENCRKFEPIEVIEDDNPVFLTEENLKARQEAMEELEEGEAISFENRKKELRK